MWLSNHEPFSEKVSQTAPFPAATSASCPVHSCGVPRVLQDHRLNDVHLGTSILQRPFDPCVSHISTNDMFLPEHSRWKWKLYALVTLTLLQLNDLHFESWEFLQKTQGKDRVLALTQVQAAAARKVVV